MAAFATPQIRDHPDPLHTRRVAMEWFRHLPALDVIARQEHVIRAFDGMRRACPAVDLDRIAAIGYLDAILEVDHRRLVKWYLENLHRTPELADRLWQVADAINRGFIGVYHAALEAALAHNRDRRWRHRVPLLIARLVHFHGVDAKLRLFRNERWIPAKWAQLNQLFLRATELGAERVPMALEGADPLAQRWSVEQEYIHVLLLLKIDTGNLTPSDLDWVSIQLRAWSRDLALEATPTAADGFCVDLNGTSGLIRRTGNDSGARVGYLDTVLLIKRLTATLASLSEPEPGVSTVHPLRRQRVAALEKIRASFLPRRIANQRRHPRVAVDLEATIRIGLARITSDLAPEGTAAARALTGPRYGGYGRDGHRGNGNAGASTTSARVAIDREAEARIAEGVEEIDVYPVKIGADPKIESRIEIRSTATGLKSARGSVPPTPMIAEEPHPPPAPKDPRWRLADRSASGWRLVAPRGVGNGLALGALVAVRPAKAGDWMLGVVRRVRKGAHDEFEAGMSLITERAVPVTLRARRPIDDDMRFEVDGVEAVSMGARFDGLYLLPPSRVDASESLRTLIIPTSEHFEGRSLFLTTSRSDYAVTLRNVVDQQADWSWVTIRVSGRASRLST